MRLVRGYINQVEPSQRTAGKLLQSSSLDQSSKVNSRKPKQAYQAGDLSLRSDMIAGEKDHTSSPPLPRVSTDRLGREGIERFHQLRARRQLAYDFARRSSAEAGRP